MRRATPTAPPHQIAATPMPPQAKPERSRYQPGGPTGWAADAVKVTGPLGTRGSPRATHAPSSTATPLAAPSRTAYSLRVVVIAPRRHEGAVERAGERAPRLATGRASWCRTVSVDVDRLRGAPRALGGEDATGARQRHRQHARRRPRRRWPAARASARMASASRCGSTARATVRSTEPSTASEVQSRHVLPDPGSGNALGDASGRPKRGVHVTAWPAAAAA